MVKNKKPTKLITNFECLAWCPWVEVCGFIPTLASSNNMLGCQGFLCDQSNKKQHQENCVHGRHNYLFPLLDLYSFLGSVWAIQFLQLYIGNLWTSKVSLSLYYYSFSYKTGTRFKILMTHCSFITWTLRILQFLILPPEVVTLYNLAH